MLSLFYSKLDREGSTRQSGSPSTICETPPYLSVNAGSQ